MLDQHTRYALIVTRGVHDADGLPVEPSEAFERFRHDLNFGQTGDPDLKEYRKDLLDALERGRRAGVAEGRRDGERLHHDERHGGPGEDPRPDPRGHARAGRLPPGPGRDADGVLRWTRSAGITFNRQTRVDPPVAQPRRGQPLRLCRSIPGAVGTIAFGKYLSPDYLVHPGEYIPPVGTRTGTPAVQGTNEIYFNLVLPSGPTPAGGWPVAIYGHGINGNKNDVAAARRGLHGLARDRHHRHQRRRDRLRPAQHAHGQPDCRRSGDVPAGGRAFDQNGDGMIPNFEGVEATAPRTIIGQRRTPADGRGPDAARPGDSRPGWTWMGTGPGTWTRRASTTSGIPWAESPGPSSSPSSPSVRAGVLNVPGGTPLDWTNTTGRRSAEIGGRSSRRGRRR